jgi:hypothetical protein
VWCEIRGRSPWDCANVKLEILILGIGGCQAFVGIGATHLCRSVEAAKVQLQP